MELSQDNMLEEEEEEEEGWDSGRDSIIRAKWCIDGCCTLAAVAERLRKVADGYEKMAAEGWELTGPVDDDYGYVRRAPSAPSSCVEPSCARARSQAS